MKLTLIETGTQIFSNIVDVPDNWTGAEGEWQIPDGHESVDGNGSSGYVWNGSSFDNPNQITEEEQIENYWAVIRVERNALLDSSDWTQGNDSPLTDDVKTNWATYRQELRDLPDTVDDPADPSSWPSAPE